MSAASDAGPSSSLLSRIMDLLDADEANAEERQVVIIQLAQTLKRDARDLTKGQKEVADTIFDDPFPLFDFLVPALVSDRDPASNEEGIAESPAQGWLRLVAQHSSSREVIMAVEQHQAHLNPRRIAPGSDSDVIEGTLQSFSSRHAALIELVAIATNRIDGHKRTRFIEAMCEKVSAKTLSLARGLAYEGQFDRLDTLEAEPVVAETLRQTLRLIKRTVASIGDIPSEEERRKVNTSSSADSSGQELTQMCFLDQAMSSLRTLLFRTVTVFHRYISVDCAGELYQKQRTGPKQRRVEPSALNQQLWQEILDTSRLLEFGPLLLMSISIEDNHPPTYLGAFILLVHMIASGAEDVDPDDLGLEDGRELFKHGVAFFVMSQKEAPLELGADEALFWYWWTVSSFLRSADNGSWYNLKFALMDIFDASLLIRRRPRAQLTLADEVFLPASSTEAKSIFLDERFFATPLGQKIVSLPGRRPPVQEPAETQSDAPAHELSRPSTETDNTGPDCEAFLRHHLSNTMERLSLAFVLLSSPSHQKTASPLLRKQLLDPLEACLPQWSKYAREELDAEAALEIELVQNLLSRVQAIAGPDQDV
ncbi:hypothetical protein JCM10908_003530 [Rhodotorula pacifica]|uniref:uncharacterized protein n=1 Tax=Rhodotorula pacifica TaxID=1495444 RepID=UPI00317EAFEA